MENFSITIPASPEVFEATGNYLLELAKVYTPAGAVPRKKPVLTPEEVAECVKVTDQSAAIEPAPEAPVLTPDTDAATAFGALVTPDDPNFVAPTTPLVTGPNGEIVDTITGEVVGQEIPPGEIVAGTATVLAGSIATPNSVPAGVEVDADGLPWDGRIHSLSGDGSHPKLKKTGQWKKKRNIGTTDPELVASVEAELRAAMATNPVVSVTTPPPPPPAGQTGVVPPPPLVVVPPVTTVTTPPPPVVDEKTFPKLMTKISAKQMDNMVVLAAVQKVGLSSTAMLATEHGKPLIPQVWADLFPGE